MLFHYFTVAVRNIFRYKLQSFVSLLGLAISFACVSLAVYWNHYEVSFDSFHRNADRIYRARNIKNGIDISQYTHGDVISPLKRDYPEIEKVCAISPIYSDIADINGKIVFPENSISFSHVTSDIFEMFDFEWMDGNAEIVSRGGNKVAISEIVAKEIAKLDSPIGFKFLVGKNTYEVACIYKTWPTHSNLKLDIVDVLPEADQNFTKGSFTYVMFKPDTDPERFIKKIEHVTLAHWLGKFPEVLNLWTPLKALHYTYPEDERNVRMSDVYLFTGFAVLLSLCALLNYLTLFISRIRGRGRDMALRAMCGSSTIQLGVLLMTEYLLLLLASLLLSMLLIEVTIPSFMELSQIEVERSSVYWGCAYLLLFILVLSLLLSLVPIFYFRRKVLRIQIDAAPIRLGYNRFRITAVCLQLMVSIFFMFCTIMMMKQIHHLLYTDIHVERKQIGVVQSLVGGNHLMDILRQIPSVKEMVPIPNSLFPLVLVGQDVAETWDDKPADMHPINYQHIWINDRVANFYGLKIKEGAQTFNLKQNEVLINEAFAQKMGVKNPIGKLLKDRVVVRGIVHDFQSQLPTWPTPPICFYTYDPSFMTDEIAFKYEGDFSVVEKKFLDIFESKKDFKFKNEKTHELFERLENKYSIVDCEAEYRKMLKPEYNILKLLGVIFVVSLLIALFGIYALVVQACEKHRKEIAIRKVNGARVIDILSLFFYQYMQQVVVAAIIAFPVGYWVIKRWLEQYTLQTEINFWVFMVVFLTTALLVTICVGWHVWQAANENPAHVIRKE